jgi:hypothetical protein
MEYGEYFWLFTFFDINIYYLSAKDKLSINAAGPFLLLCIANASSPDGDQIHLLDIKIAYVF